MQLQVLSENNYVNTDKFLFTAFEGEYMDLEYLRKCMKSTLSEKRYRHSLGVEDVCYDLALIHGEDTLLASVAGILHDCAKYLTDDKLLQECEKYNIEISDTERQLPQALLHSKIGAIYAREKYGITEESVLKAIEYHTTGRPAMTKLEKIVFVADFIEPNRKADVLKMYNIRESAYQNLDEAVIKILERSVKYLNDKKSLIDPMTMLTYEYYVNKVE